VSFYKRFEMLCDERNMKPQALEMQKIAGVSSPAISGWKNKGALPKDSLLNLPIHKSSSKDGLFLCLKAKREQTVKIKMEVVRPDRALCEVA